jgi:hypothetical protein
VSVYKVEVRYTVDEKPCFEGSTDSQEFPDDMDHYEIILRLLGAMMQSIVHSQLRGPGVEATTLKTSLSDPTNTHIVSQATTHGLTEQ